MKYSTKRILEDIIDVIQDILCREQGEEYPNGNDAWDNERRLSEIKDLINGL